MACASEKYWKFLLILLHKSQILAYINLDPHNFELKLIWEIIDSVTHQSIIVLLDTYTVCIGEFYTSPALYTFVWSSRTTFWICVRAGRGRKELSDRHHFCYSCSGISPYKCRAANYYSFTCNYTVLNIIFRTKTVILQFLMTRNNYNVCKFLFIN